jgi:transcriptional accessory protein Tex/SPT6
MFNLLKQKGYENSLGYIIITISYNMQLNENKVHNKDYKDALLSCKGKR